MNRTVFSSLILTAFLFALLHVQPARAQKFEGGIMAGLCASQVAGDKLSGYNKAGIFGGGYVALRLSGHAALRLELDYIQKGSRKNPKSDSSSYDPNYILRVDYVEMPLLLRMKYGKRIIAEAGPAMAFLVHSYEEADELDVTVENSFEKQNLSIIAGVNYLVNERVSVGLRTNNSLNSIRVNKEVDGYRRRFGSYGQFNDVLVINFSYKL